MEAQEDRSFQFRGTCPTAEPWKDGIVANIMALCAPMPNRDTEAETGRRRKERLHYFAIQRGNTAG